MREFVIGDIHGGFKALKQVLKASHFNYDSDRLIVLGDVADGWPQTPEAVEELLKIRNLIAVLGNHDVWCLDWLEMGKRPLIWTEQGGRATVDAYVKRRGNLMTKHREDFFKKMVKYHVDHKNRLFVHGGFSPFVPIETQSTEHLTWDRAIAEHVLHGEVVENQFQEVYLGHTTTSNVSSEPLYAGNVWLMDTGAGWEGKLSLMDIDTKEVFQSDKVASLYPNVKGR